MDEAFEVLTLLQTGKRELMPLVFLDAPGGKFWKNWLDYIQANLLEGGMISPDDLSLFRVTDSVEEAVADILRFYCVFHSMEYIQNRLVLRLNKPLASASVNLLRQAFADILTDGDFRQQDSAIAGESPRPELAGLSRLTFHFNRRSLGRLRQLIDSINGGDAVPRVRS
jgi:hypothetical protein